MSEPRGADLDLIAEFKAGSESAARVLFDKYCERLMKLARRRIGQRMTSRIDPEDVLQSAFRTFFTRVRNDEFSFVGEDDLFKLLVRLTVHKTLRRIAFHRAGKRNPERETGQGGEDNAILERIATEVPAAEMEIALLDELERFMGRLAPLDREVLALKIQGYSTAEIAEKLSSYDRKIRRILERLQETAKDQFGLAGR